MTKVFRLPHDELRALKIKTKLRDKQKCRVCKSGYALASHHIRFLSDNGPDTSENLVTLCAGCHDKVHGKVAKDFIVILAGDGNEKTVPNANESLTFKKYKKVGRRVRWLNR